MRAEALAELCAVMSSVPGGTPGTPGTQNAVPAQKCPSFHAFLLFQVKTKKRNLDLEHRPNIARRIRRGRARGHRD